MIFFLTGVLTMGYLVASLFFLRFRTQTGDRLFAWFAAAFFILAAQRVMVVLLPTSDLVYVVRLLAFVMILIAIWEKNRASA